MVPLRSFGSMFATHVVAPIVLAGILPIAIVAGAQHAAGGDAQVRAPAGTFHSGVDLVRLGVTARDPSGRIVHDLRREEFAVHDDGVLQEISHFGQHESPISVVVLLDRSSSMHGEKMMHAIDGVEAFVKALRAPDETLLITFGGTVDALGEFGLEPRTILRELRRVNADGGTRLYDAVVEAARLIGDRERHEKRAILVLSDGEDTLSTARLEEAAGAVKRTGVPLYAIGIEFGQDVYAGRAAKDALWRRLEGDAGVKGLMQMADASGGWAYSIEAARRCKEVCLRVADELRNQYLLGCSPANLERDGRWHQIGVRTSREGVKLATRPGYFASGS